MMYRIRSALGPVDILVNAAGITRDGVFKRMSPNDWYAVINTNLNSVFNVTRQVIEGMMERGWGRIVNISSVNALKGQFGQTNYSAAKAGMHGFTKALAQEVVKKGVTVNTISPGYVDTDMVRAIKPEVLESIVASIPMGRLAKPEEIAGLVAYPLVGGCRATSPAPTSRSTAGCTWSDCRSGRAPASGVCPCHNFRGDRNNHCNRRRMSWLRAGSR